MLRTLIKFKPRDVPLVVALRNTAAVALPLAVGAAVGRTGIGLGVSVGALNTMFSDQPGPYRLRLRRMLLTAGAASISAFAGYTLGANDALLTLAALLWGFAGGMLVALGTDAGRIGLISMILLVVTGSEPRAPVDAIGPALLMFGGGVLLTVFALAAWPLQRYRPERFALARLCRGLAASTRGHDSTEAPPVTQAVTDVENLLHGSHRSRGPAMEAFRVLAEQIERIRLELVALTGLDDRLPDAEARATLPRLREYAARALDSVADALAAGEPPLKAVAALEGFDAAMQTLDTPRAGSDDPALTVARAHAHALAGQLRAAVRNAEFAGSRGELRLADLESRLPRPLRPRNAAAILRANLRLSSTACRHAIRCGVCLAAAVLGARLYGGPHGYWIPMTTAIVLKPDFAGTFNFGLLRVIGTLLGLALATVLVHFAFGSEWSRIALFAVLCFGFRQFTTMHYGVGVMFLTSSIVVLLSFEGIAPGETMSARLIGTTLGSTLALLAYLLWPTWERGRVRDSLADLLDAYRRYFLAVLGDDARIRADARTTSRGARTNAQASLDRLRGEPRPDPHLVALAEGIFANANRFARVAMALEAIRQSVGHTPVRSQAQRFAAEVDTALDGIIRNLRHGTVLPSGGSLRDEQRRLRTELRKETDSAANRIPAAAWIDASDRITNCVNTLAHLVRPGGRSADARATD